MNGIRWRISLTLTMALLLTIIPLPTVLMGLRPAWVLIVIIYLEYYLSNSFSVPLVFFMGLALDILLSSIIGEHIFALTLVTWIASNKWKRFYFFSMSQQLALLAFLVLSYQLILLLVDAFAGFSVSLMNCVASTISTVLIWPWIRLLGQEFLLTQVRYQR